MMSYIRERWSVLVIAIGGVYALHAFVVAPAIDERASVVAEAEAVAEELDEASASIVTNDAPRSTSRVARLIDLRFGEDTPIGEQDHIHTLASEAGLSVEGVDPDTNPRDEEYGPFSLRSRQIRVSATGSYEQVARFLSSIDASPMGVLEDFSLRRADEGDDVRVSLTVRTARIERAGGIVADGGTE